MKNKSKVMIIGNRDTAALSAIEVLKSKQNIIVIDEITNNRTIIVEGIKYIETPIHKPKLSKSFNKLLMIAAMFGGSNLLSDMNNKEKYCPQGVIDEFILIKAKTSKLSRKKRDSMEAYFLSYFKPAK